MPERVHDDHAFAVASGGNSTVAYAMATLEEPAPEALIAAPGRVRRRLRVPIAAALVLGIGLLIVLAVGSVLVISLLGARANTLNLLRDRADIGLELLESRVESQLEPIHNLGFGIAAMIASAELDITDRAQVEATFRAGLNAVPQATALIFVNAGFEPIRVGRTMADLNLMEVEQSGRYVAGLQGMLDTDAGVESMVESAADMAADSAWIPPVWVQSLKQPVLALERPVRRDGEFLGVVLVVVALGDLSEFLARLAEMEAANAFILYDREHVLSHPKLFDMMLTVETGSDEVPLPTIAGFGDPALQLVQDGEEYAAIVSGDDGMRMISGAYEDDDNVVILRDLVGFGGQPWQIGLTFDKAEVNAEINRLTSVALLGVAILVVALILALWVGRSMTRQIRTLAVAADSLRTLDIANAAVVPRSRFRELDDAAQAFNAMTAALRWFETYVPKSLVLRLMRRSEDVIESRELVLTVMFTDIRGFSTLAEHMRAREIATLLNSHFEMLSGCIEAEGGTVDKFIGDAVMAFWGAPEAVSDHAMRALRAAQAIQRAVMDDNRARRAAEEPVVAVRVGLHTGPVVVGNIGSKSRVNYTVVGDTVNTASRLEALVKEIGAKIMGDTTEDPQNDCIVLLSEATAAGAGGAFPLTDLGSHTIRGRRDTVRAYKLAPPADAAAAPATDEVEPVA